MFISWFYFYIILIFNRNKWQNIENEYIIIYVPIYRIAELIQ